MEQRFEAIDKRFEAISKQVANSFGWTEAQSENAAVMPTL